MASTVTEIEEIPRSDPVPKLCLKVINLKLNDRRRSLSPPSRHSNKAVTKRSADQRLARHRLHKLRSYEHLVKDLPLICRDKHPPQSQSHASTSGGGTGVKVKVQSSHDGQQSVYLFFMEGFKNVVKGDEEKMLRTILELLNEEAMLVARKEPLFQCKKSSSRGLPLEHTALHTALLGLNEVLDPGVLDISRSGLVGLGQCITVTIFFHDQLAALSRSAWHSSYAQFLRDAWMGFGCVGAMVVMSSMRQ